MLQNNEHNWKYCVAGNIVETRTDENGQLRHGTAAFRGGAKVYLNGRFYEFGDEDEMIEVVGLTRGHRYQVIRVKPEQIVNVRFSRVWKPKVLEIMNNWEFYTDWWHDTDEDRQGAERFVSEWHEYMD